MENPNEVPQDEPSAEGLLSVRALGIMLAGVVVGVAVGVLRYSSGQPVPAAIVEGLIALGATVLGLHRLVERSQRRRRRAHHTTCEHVTASPRQPLEDTAGDEVQRVGEKAAELGQRIKDAMTDEPEPIP